MADDLPEVVELEEAAAWRLRQVDADPNDRASAAAAALLQSFADSLRQHADLPLLSQLHAVCNWLGESGMIDDYAQAVRDYHVRIGVDQAPATIEDYVGMLLRLAQQLT